ncbi:hypothetical protein ACIOWE_02065 [Pseudomonas sp. NPDC087598]|uniref:D-alanine--D-alanine ligase family protein n=1 Tax=Pseudomonas sp. NPDC087598 TaxID=3364440 RepID=UPI00382BD401
MEAASVISIVFGGNSPEHDASVDSFSYVYECLQDSRVAIRNVYFVDVRGLVHEHAFQRSMDAAAYLQSSTPMSYAQALRRWKEDDCYLLNLLHGRHGEDGHLQGAAALVGLRGSFGSTLASSLSMSKFHMSHYASSVCPLLRIPQSTLLRSGEDLDYSLPGLGGLHSAVVIKPNASGSSIDTERYATLEGNESLVSLQLERIYEGGNDALVQQYICGVEYTVGCLRTTDGGIRPLPVVRITSREGFFGFVEKNTVGSVVKEFVADSPLTDKLKAISVSLFSSVGFSNMCRFDFIVSEDGNIFFLEANSIPGLMRNSLYPKMLRMADIDIVGVIADLARAT